MIITKTHYHDHEARDILSSALADLLNNLEAEPLFICIGSDHHLLDCFGPLTGTMLAAVAPDLPVFGTLEHPLHAQNLVKEIRGIKKLHADKIEIAIDASVGNEEEIGIIQLRQGSLLPGKALSKSLPPVGQYSITGVVDVRLNRQGVRINKRPGLGHVYHMAKLLSEIIGDWFHGKHLS
ncbi:MAG: spore protease YyaC [Syntrophomonas sp.]|nr:spore protease YyaC [Syntrophomonas sp.]